VPENPRQVETMKAIAARWSALIVVAVGCCAATSAPVRIDVKMIDYGFVPDHLTLEHGVHYDLHLENRGKETHEFTAPVFLAAAKIDNPQALNREHTEVVVEPGESKDVFLTAGAPGAYDLRCSDHDWTGMVGGIVVR
jgi:plastocyanin